MTKAALNFPGTQRRSSAGGADEAQHGLLSRVKIGRIPAAAASATRRSVNASALASTWPGRSGSSVDQRSSARTTLAWSLRAAAISRSATLSVEPLKRPITFTPPSAPAEDPCALVAPADWHAAADQAASASASAIPTRRPADACRRPAMLTRYSSRARGAQDAWQ